MDVQKAIFQRIIDAINGNVQSQGVKVDFSAWMVPGSERWNSTSDQIKAQAYQAALAMGWSRQSLAKAVCEVYRHVDKYMAEYTLNTLEELAKEYPHQFNKKEKKSSVILSDGHFSRMI